MTKSMDWFPYDNSLRHERVKIIFFEKLDKIFLKTPVNEAFYVKLQAAKNLCLK